MPQTIRQLRIFLAAPVDVQAETSRLEKVVREINIMAADERHPRLELIHWKTHAYPGFSTDPQAVINEQIPNDYDIFIGIFWCRLGTPTPRAKSGTVEEFQAAYNRWQVDPHSVTLMIYFKDEAVSPSNLDPDQFAGVARFRSSLAEAGGLVWHFKTADEFETQVRLHLNQAIQKIGKTHANYSTMAIQSAEILTAAGLQQRPLPEDSLPASGVSEEDDLGLLDYIELGEEAAARQNAAIEKMTAAVENMGKVVLTRVAELEELKSTPDIGAARLLFDQTARDLNEFSASIQAETPQFVQAHADLMKYAVGAAALSLRSNQDPTTARQQAEYTLRAVETLFSVIGHTRVQMRTFRQEVSTLPRMTVTLNKAKRRVVQTLEDLDSGFEEALSKSRDVQNGIRDLIE